MLKLVKCGNSEIKRALRDGKRSHNLSGLSCPVLDGVTLCKWCAERPVLSKKHSYCGTKCKDSAWLTMSPQNREGCAYLLFKQFFKCASCDYSYKEVIRDILRGRNSKERPPTLFYIGRFLKGVDKKEYWAEYLGIRNHRAVQVDHIIPVWDNGETFGFDNLQALCVDCHKHKSKLEYKERAGRKRDFILVDRQK